MSRLPMLMQLELVISACCTPVFLFQACLKFSDPGSKELTNVPTNRK